MTFNGLEIFKSALATPFFLVLVSYGRKWIDGSHDCLDVSQFLLPTTIPTSIVYSLALVR